MLIPSRTTIGIFRTKHREFETLAGQVFKDGGKESTAEKVASLGTNGQREGRNIQYEIDVFVTVDAAVEIHVRCDNGRATGLKLFGTERTLCLNDTIRTV
jgi:hypothetical protein